MNPKKKFYALVGFCTIIAAVTFKIPAIAMWVGFAFAGYSVIANDSIQTLGTFLSSNRERPWWLLWLYVSGIFLVTSYYSWATYSGDVTYGRLASKGFNVAPTSFTFLQLCAPLVLLILTRYSIPVSTTFLILSAFTTSGTSLGKVVTKSLSGYVIAFVCSIALWSFTQGFFEKYREVKPANWWYPAQWICAGMLWSVWIMQDAANVAVYLPRALSPGEMLAYAGLLVAGMALLFKQRGGEIQDVVNEKKDTSDIRQATVISLVYAGVLYYFKVVSSIPMSTTWVFIGLLAGRELGITIQNGGGKLTRLRTFKMIARDLGKVTIGLLVSVLLAVMINPVVRRSLLGF